MTSNPETGRDDPSFNTKWDENRVFIATFPNNLSVSAITHRDYQPVVMNIYTTPDIDDGKDDERVTTTLLPIWNDAILQQLPLPLQDYTDNTEEHVYKPKISEVLSRLETLSLSPGPDTTTILAFRNTIRDMLHDYKDFKADIQRLGPKRIIIRRHVSYTKSNPFDHGHQFETLCRQFASNINNQQDIEYRAITSGSIGKYELICSCEVDLFISSEDDCTTEPIELKCTSIPVNHYIVARQNWLQCKVAGVSKIISAYKSESTDRTHTIIHRIDVGSVEEQYKDERGKNTIIQHLELLLRFIDTYVTDMSAIYTIERKKCGNIRLFKIERGTEIWPVIEGVTTPF